MWNSDPTASVVHWRRTERPFIIGRDGRMMKQSVRDENSPFFFICAFTGADLPNSQHAPEVKTSQKSVQVFWRHDVTFKFLKKKSVL